MKKMIGLAVLIGTAFGAASGAQAEEGPWMVRGRIINMQVANGNDPAASVAVDNKVFPEVDISYFFTRNIAAELILTYPQEHDVTVQGSKIGTLKHLPPTLTVQYHFMPEATFRPYAGVGLNFTWISDVKLPGVPGADVDRTSVGPALQVGADVKLADKWFFNVDVKKVYIKTDVTVNGAKLTTLHIDPLLASVGIGYRF